jgi:hypothetical protein
MNRIPKLIFLIIFFILITKSLYSQPNKDFIFKKDFVPLLDSLISPPANCEEAFALTVFDSAKMENVHIPLLNEQENGIELIFTELKSNTTKKEKHQFGQPPSGNGPPGGSPPGGFGPPPGMSDIREDFMKMKDDLDDANSATDKITVILEKFKDELKEMQAKVNDDLHETVSSDDKSREKIINDFLSSGANKFNKYKRTFRENMLILDGIIKKYDYGTKVKTIPLKSEILNMQMTEATALKLLMKVTLEFVNIGAKFYR